MKQAKVKDKDIQVSVIICAYNEEKHIARTLRDLLKCKTADEVIVVNDGSKDKTEAVLKEFKNRIKLVTYKRNRGKGHAFVRGVKTARGKIIVMLDAHLDGLKDKHVKTLVRPISKHEANYVLGYERKKDRFGFLTGQRAYPRILLIPHLKTIKKTRFGLETYLNDIFKPQWGKTIALEGLVHLIKHHKMSKNEVLGSYLQEILEIARAKAELQVRKYSQLEKLVNSKEIKTIKSLKKKVMEIKDKEVTDLFNRYIIPYARKREKRER